MSKNQPVSDELWTRAGRRAAMQAPVREVGGHLESERAPGDSEAMHRGRMLELELRLRRVAEAEDWSHKNEGTVETHAKAAKVYQGALARMHLRGEIDDDQLAWSDEICAAAESIERDVAVKVVDYEPRIDCSASAKDALVEGILRVRREVAYTYWRGWLKQPKRAVLDMIVGDAKPYSTVAREYRIGRQRAKRMLIDALDRWPVAMDRAEDEVDAASIAAMYAGLI